MAQKISPQKTIEYLRSQDPYNTSYLNDEELYEFAQQKYPDIEWPVWKPKPNVISHPPHYTHSKFETWDVIDAWGLGYNLGNVVKYISRADHKASKLEDLKKAKAYLSREIETLEFAYDKSN